MARWNLRDAARRTRRSITTLRRYIRSGRLRAEKIPGRYGPEYFVAAEALLEAGLEVDETGRQMTRVAHPVAGGALAHPAAESVPLGLFQELQMKHEQLLVQYGMVRVNGLRAIELRGEVEATRERTARCEADLALLREKSSREISLLRERLRKTELELEGRTIEATALREKLRTLETIARNAPAPPELAQQLDQLSDQHRRVERLEAMRFSEPQTSPWPPPRPRADESEH